jgi:hypothetical protein
MHGIICLDCEINNHCALNMWRLFDVNGIVSVKNLKRDFKTIFRGTPGSIAENSEIGRIFTQLLHQPLYIYKIYKIYTLKH